MSTEKSSNSKPLLLVESPAKAKTIYNYLKGQFNVMATMGHVIDLPTNRIGVDVDANYTPEYVKIKGKSKIIQELTKAIKQAPLVYLAQDPDREGESIAWQTMLLPYVKIPSQKTKTKKQHTGIKLEAKKDTGSVVKDNNNKFKRVVFHEITKEAVNQAIKDSKEIDLNLVEAQQTRRILDRLVGYPLSELLWKKIRYGLSAGRVQSAALRLLVERQQEIDAFTPEDRFYLGLEVRAKGHSLSFIVSDVKKHARLALGRQEYDILKKELSKILLKGKVFVKDVAKSVQKIYAPAPFITSTLQQEANRTLGFSAKTTMSIAQQLYQGIDIPGIGRKALITYMRTDSVKLSFSAIKKIRHAIKNTYGSEYLNPKIVQYKTKSKLAQEAHEAIRPIHFELSPEVLKGKIPEPHLKLYTLIWRRTLATQFKPAEYLNIIAILDEKLPLQNAALIFKNKALIFEGFKKIYQTSDTAEKQSEKLGDLTNVTKTLEEAIASHEPLDVSKLIEEAFKTSPPQPYTDATLVKALEKLGIGRPSTYATIIDTLLKRGYAERQGKFLIPTDTGKIVLKFLKQHFKEIVDYNFTAQMEDNLDKIAQGMLSKSQILDEFYPKFQEKLAQKDKEIQKQDLVILDKTDKKCPKCGADMVLKLGRYGKFYSCSRFPECDGMLTYIDEEKYVIPDKAKTGEWVLKAGPYGKFWAHKDYPKVKETSPLLLKETCPKCGAHLVERKTKKGRTFIGCSAYPQCDYIKK